MNTQKPKRLWMAIKNKKQNECNWDSGIAQIHDDHISDLARLMEASYQGTIDFEGETLDQCKEEIKSTIEGKNGPFVTDASFVIFKDQKAVAACLITVWKNQPLIAFSMTDPEYQGKGLARQLISKAMDVLADKYSVLYLVVTNGNTPAQNLYRKIGFIELGEALPSQPPLEMS